MLRREKFLNCHERTDGEYALPKVALKRGLLFSCDMDQDHLIWWPRDMVGALPTKLN